MCNCAYCIWTVVCLPLQRWLTLQLSSSVEIGTSAPRFLLHWPLVSSFAFSRVLFGTRGVLQKKSHEDQSVHWQGSAFPPSKQQLIWFIMSWRVKKYVPLHERGRERGKALHGSTSFRSGQTTPPFSACWRTPLDLVLVPSLQVALHVPQGDQSPTLQLTVQTKYVSIHWWRRYWYM